LTFPGPGASFPTERKSHGTVPRLNTRD